MQVQADVLDHCDQRRLRCGRLAQLLDAAAARHAAARASRRAASSLVLGQVGRAALERCGRHLLGPMVEGRWRGSQGWLSGCWWCGGRVVEAVGWKR